MKRILSSLFIAVIQHTALTIWHPVPLWAQYTFSRNDNHDFRGRHHLVIYGTSFNNVDISINSNSDFRLFKFHARSRYWIELDYAAFFIARLRVDMNSDGTWEQNWTTANEIDVSYTYPNPPNGISANHTITVGIELRDIAGYPHQITRTHEVTIFSTPRVYLDVEGNAFVQLRDEDATAKIPVLMVEGFDPLSEKFPEDYYNLTWDLVNTDLIPNGYEVFILNFHDGGRDLRLNAEVVLKALEKIHEICPNYKIALAGLSMGGPIARYALAKKEGLGGTHDVGLFLSYDSPQGDVHSVHVSPNMQDWIYTLDPNIGAVAKMQAGLQSVAAKQMLEYNTYDRQHILHDEFYDDLNTRNGDGYPHQSYNVAVSNGSFIANPGYGSEGRHLMTLKINDNLINQVPAVRLDCGTGSKISDIRMRRFGDVFPNPFFNITYELAIIFNPSYEPTYAALDLVNPQLNDLTGDIVSFERSKFDDYVVQPTPLQHHELSTTTRNKIVEWLNRNFDITVNYNLLEGGSVGPDVYSVRILHGASITVPPKTVNVNGQSLTYHFSHWEDGNTNNPRTFYSSPNEIHTATMKSHLRTNNPNALAGIGQRKLSVDVGPIDSKAALAYSSGGEIWLTESDASLSSFTNEARVSDGSSGFGFPSVVATATISEASQEGDGSSVTPPHVGIVYQKTVENGLGIAFREKRGENWESPKYLETYNFGVVDATPVIGRTGSQTNPRLLFVWVRQEGIKHCIADWMISTNDWDWSFQSQLVPGTGAGDARPSISNGNMNGAPLFLTWDNEESISLQKFSNSWLTTPLTVPASYATVSSSSQVAADPRSGNEAHIVWEATNPFVEPVVPTVMYQAYLGEDKWSAADQFVPEEGGFFHPTITYLDDGTLVMAWDDGSSMYQARRTAGNESWTIDAVYDAQVGPSLPQPGTSSTLSSARILSTATSGPPYVLELTDEIMSAFQRTTGLVRVERGREINVAQRPQSKSDPASFFSLRISSAAVRFSDGTEQALELASVNNREPGLGEETAWGYLATKPRNISAATESLIVELVALAKSPGSILGNGEEAIRFSFDLVDSQSDRVIRRIGVERAVRENGMLKYSIRERIGDLAGRSVYIRPRLKGLARGRQNMAYSLVNVHRVYSDSSVSRPAEKPAVQQQQLQQMPTEFAVRPGYPNPFNPTTQIRFELPEPSTVSLIVYDVLGREVTQLASGTREAGYHLATWDAASVSSGVYFARFTATDAAGNVRLNNVNKLLLTK